MAIQYQGKTLGEFIATEARLEGIEPEEYYKRFRQAMLDDDAQGLADLEQCALDLIQDESQAEIDAYLLDLKDAQEEDPDFFTPDIFGPRPPFPVSIICFDSLYYHAGYTETLQEISALVLCDDGKERYAIWTAECDVDGVTEITMDWVKV